MIQAPTDNLYKFLAIFGLLVLGFSVYVPLEKYVELGREVAKWSAAWKPFSVRARLGSDDAREQLRCAIEIRDGKAKRERLKYCRELEANAAHFEKESRARQVELAELEAAKIVLERLAEQYMLYRNIGIALGVTGLLMSSGGFWLWYRRVQKQLDRVAAGRHDGGTA